MTKFTKSSQKEIPILKNDLYSTLVDAKIACEQNVPLSGYSSFRIGGRGELGIFPKSVSELVFCISKIKRSGKKFYVIGNGSNILFGDGELDGVFIFTKGLCGVRVEGNRIYAEAGASLSAIATAAEEGSLTGLEFAKGIPGSLGGAVYMNAGAYGGQMSDVTVSSTALDTENGETVTLTEHGFSYRDSVYMRSPSLVCLSAELRLSAGNGDEIKEKMRSLAVQRREKQPLEFPSAGSYFKRPEGHFAGKLIEDCGLKGLRVGGAEVSKKHAGFIINVGGATAADVSELEEKIVSAVYERFGVTLEREVRLIK